MKRILFLSTIAVGERDSGKAVVINGIDAFLRDAGSRGSVSYFFCGPSSGLEAGERRLTLVIPSIFEKIFNLFVYTLILRRKSIQESLFFCRRFKKAIAQFLRDQNIDVVIYDTIRMGQYICPVDDDRQVHLLYLEDLFSTRYERLLRALRGPFAQHVNAVGNFGKNMPRAAELIVSKSRTVQRLLVKFERGLVAKSERFQVGSAHKSFLLNYEEAELISGITRRKVEVIPPSLGMSNKISRNWTGEKNILFIGGLNLPHNSVGLLEFINGPFRKLLQSHPELVLWIVGKGLTKALEGVIAQCSRNICYCGYVPDLGELMSRSACMVAPLLFGSGVKLKAIEAFAAGMPLVSTEFGVEGTKFVDNVHGFLRSDLADFPSAIERTFSCSTNEMLSRNARSLFSSEYSADAVHRRYSEIFDIA